MTEADDLFMKPIPMHRLDDAARRLMARGAELARRDAFDITCTDFLTPREQRLFHAAVAGEGQGDRLFFCGGARGAERRCAVLVPEWFLGDAPGGDPFGDEREEFLFSLTEDGAVDLSDFITAVSLAGSDYASLSHRDWLGAILATGLKREVLGDIAVLDEHRAIAFCTRQIAPFIEDTLTRAGSDAVHAARTDVPAGFTVPRAFEDIEVTVASPRLDGVVRALTNLSRADAAELVRTGEAEVNYFPEENPDAPITDGDVLSIRGFGKYIVDSANTVTRRGRNRLVARKYK